MPIDVHVYSSLEALPERLVAFLDSAAAGNFFRSLAWYRTVLRTTGPSGDQPRVYAAEIAGKPAAVLILRERQAAGRLKTHMLLGPSAGIYADLYEPFLDAEFGIAGLREIVAAIARASPPFHVLRFEWLDPAAPRCAALERAFRASHMLVQHIEEAPDHCCDEIDAPIDDYIARRWPNMRHFMENQVDGLAGSGTGRFALVTGGPALKPAFIDYSLVDVQSWKDREPYPDCLLALLEASAAAGALRLGLFYVGDEPAAAQIWIVSGGRATLWRLHQAQKFAKLLPGAMLTFEMLRQAAAADSLRHIDFGTGDDALRQEWAGRRLVWSSLIVFNPRTLKGWIAIAFHIARQTARPIRDRTKDVLRRLVRRG
jgi:CelD/BcsL family acetyltransferase involved in cellulose biosynthesis